MNICDKIKSLSNNVALAITVEAIGKLYQELVFKYD